MEIYLRSFGEFDIKKARGEFDELVLSENANTLDEMMQAMDELKDKMKDYLDAYFRVSSCDF